MVAPLVNQEQHKTMHEPDVTVVFHTEWQRGGWAFRSREVLCKYCPVCGKVINKESKDR